MENKTNQITAMEQPRSKDQKCPVVLVLDTSGSMSGTGIADLNRGIEALKQHVLNDAQLLNRLEIGIVSFDDASSVQRPIDLISVDSVMPSLTTGGVTNTVAGINTAIAEVEDRKRFYRQEGEQYYRPYIFLFSDGASTNSEEEIDAIRRSLQQGLDAKRYIFVPVAVGITGDCEGLARLTPHANDERLKKIVRVLKVKDTSCFQDIFQFLSASVGAAAANGGSAVANLDPKVGHMMEFTLN